MMSSRREWGAAEIVGSVQARVDSPRAPGCPRRREWRTSPAAAGRSDAKRGSSDDSAATGCVGRCKSPALFMFLSAAET